MTPLLLALALQAATPPTPAEPLALDGTWTVDLTVDPAQPYLKTMQLTLAPGGTVTGDFYDSEILAGRWKRQKGKLCVSFRTTDGAGPYHTAACQAGDHVEGQTWAEHRDFVFIWTAARPTED
jgi:hypothetical protein